MSQLLASLDNLVKAGTLNRFVVQFAQFLVSRDPHADDSVILAGARVAHALSHQNVCINPLQPDTTGAFAGLGQAAPERAALTRSTLVGSPDARTLLTLDGDRLYLSRYHDYELNVAEALLARAAIEAEVDTNLLKSALSSHFPANTSAPGKTAGPDWQKVAAAIAATRHLAIITGGPGTGKTTTVVKLLAAILEASFADSDAPFIALAAPTGKAAARMTSALQQALAHIEVSALIRERLPSTATTLHRLLGARAHQYGFRYHRDNLLPIDILVIDEVSMVDLALLSHTIDALPPTTRLILLGDPDQLPSVEAGNVLQDIAAIDSDRSATFSANQATRLENLTGQHLATGTTRNRLADCLVELRQNFRFGDSDLLGFAADRANRGSLREFLDVFPANADPGAAPAAEPGPKNGASCRHTRIGEAPDPAALRGVYASYAHELRAQADVERLIDTFEQVRVLGPKRDGPGGITSLNSLIEAQLRAAGAITDEHDYYHGRPIMVTRNDYNLRLYNGDIGICHVESGQRLVAFRRSDGAIGHYLASRLPPHETCFAMTIHKSQGSEFDHVSIVLPPVSDPQSAEIYTRELLYTGITRARHSLSLYAEPDALALCFSQQTVRSSGLGLRLSLPGPAATSGTPEDVSTATANPVRAPSPEPSVLRQLELF